MTTFRGVFLTGDDPGTTAAFYRDVAGPPIESVGAAGEYVYWRMDRDGMQIAIHDAAAFADHSHPPNPDSNVTHRYFTIEDQRAFVSHLDALGVTPVSVDDVVVTVIDPDGRRVMFGTA